MGFCLELKQQGRCPLWASALFISINPPALFWGVQINRNAKFLLILQCKKAPDPKIEGFRFQILAYKNSYLIIKSAHSYAF